MKKFSTYLVVMFMIVFWVIRIIVTLMSELGKDFMGMVPMNETFEIAILFATLLCLVLIAKRKLTGCLLYIEMNEENIKKEISKDILKDIDYQLDNGTFNNNEYRQAYALIRDNINNLNKNSIKIELIEAEHNYEMNALNWRFSFILRFLKK